VIARSLAKHALLYGLALLWLVPTFWMASTAFKPEAEVLSFTPRWIPSALTLGHVRHVLTRFHFVTWLTNSLVIAAGATTVSLVTATLAAYALARLRWPGRNALFVLFVASIFIPWEINAIPLFFIAKDLELLSTYPGVFLPISAMPISLFLLRQFFVAIPRELEDAARIDGCGHLRSLLYVVVPVSGPAFGALGIFVFIFAWNEFFWSFIALQKSQMLTIPIGMKTVTNADDIRYTTLMALSFLASLPALLVFLALRRHVIAGISMAGVRR
jgi:ABC-type glycerol-3-phosphate transport system permease component